LKLVIEEVLDQEICHYTSPQMAIFSRSNRVSVYWPGGSRVLVLPAGGWERAFSWSRLARRALRLDKCNVAPVGEDLVIIRRGLVFHYDRAAGTLTPTLRLKNCRNILHQSIAVTPDRALYFGEYGNNPERLEVPIYRSRDGGKSWDPVFTFPGGKVKHVHGCYFDPFEKKVWVFSGDFKDECFVLCADPDFQQVEWIGNGQQEYRACNAFFEEDSIHWIMDSQLEDSYHIEMDRKTRQIRRKQRFPGPVWYIKKLEDRFFLAATAQEIGPGVHDRYAHLMVSRDLETWEDLYQFKHDGLPKRYFKFGVVGFADGPQSAASFYIFLEALQGLDGKTVRCRLEE
jgi:hypothetical protein